MRLEWHSSRELKGRVRSFRLAVEIEGNTESIAERATRMLRRAAGDLEPDMVEGGKVVDGGTPGTPSGKDLGGIEV